MKIDPKTNKPIKVEHGGYDDDYIHYYTNDPKAGRSNALRLAGYVGNYLAQEAMRIHKRCQERIKIIFTDRIANLDGAAYQQLQGILDSSIKDVGYNNMLSAIQKGMDYSGRKQAEQVVITKPKTIDDLDNNIDRLLKEVAKQENKELH